MVRDNDSPFWNEYFTFDINPKTKDITIDIYNYEKTEKGELTFWSSVSCVKCNFQFCHECMWLLMDKLVNFVILKLLYL